MKKTKMFFVSLFASAFLFSAVPHAVASEKMSYEYKVERIANYLKGKEMLFDLNIASLDLPEMDYGLHKVKLGYHKGVMIGIYKKESISILKPDLAFIDFKINGYGPLDRVYKKNTHIVPDQFYDEFVPVQLTEKDSKKFNYAYREIIEKFYSENEKNMEDLERALEQKKYIDDLFGIIDKK